MINKISVLLVWVIISLCTLSFYLYVESVKKTSIDHLTDRKTGLRHVYRIFLFVEDPQKAVDLGYKTEYFSFRPPELSENGSVVRFQCVRNKCKRIIAHKGHVLVHRTHINEDYQVVHVEGDEKQE